MRICEVCPYDLSEPGGVQAQVFGLARALVETGHEVAILGPGKADLIERIPGIEIRTVGSTVSVEANGSQAPISISLASARSTMDFLRRRKFDVLHLHEPLVPGPTLTSLLSVDAPMVGTFHLSGTSASYKYLGPMVRKLARRLNVRCAVSDQARETAASYLGGDFTVLFNGVDLERFSNAAPRELLPPSDAGFMQSSTNEFTVAFVGRHEQRKGLVDLLEAVRICNYSAVEVPGGEVGRLIKLRIAGEGPQTNELKGRYGTSNIEWMGRLNDVEVVQLIRQADCLCVPSTGGESFGIVLVEAMAVGTPVVASDIPAYRLVAGGDAAELFPPGEPEELALALGRLINDAERMRWLSATGQARAQSFSMVELANRYSEIFCGLTA